MATMYLLIGIPGSGKTYWAERNKERLNAMHISSDAIREEISGNASVQSDNKLVFATLHSRCESALSSGQNVIFDATNVAAKNRQGIIEKYKDFDIVAVYIATPKSEAIKRNDSRDRVVPAYVIGSMSNRLVPPSLEEGFKEIIEVN